MEIENTLVCLVSDQRMQNVIPVFQRGFHFERLVLLASELDSGKINPTFRKVADDLALALMPYGIDSILWKTPVNPMDPTSTCRICSEIINNYGGASQVWVNFTGGTKPMSIGAYLAGDTVSANMVYIDTQKDQIFHFHRGECHSQPFDLVPMDVRLILQIQGRPVDEKKTEEKRLAPGFLDLGREIYQRRPGSFDVFTQLREYLPRSVAKTDRSQRGEDEFVSSMAVPRRFEQQAPWLFKGFEQLDTLRRIGENILLNRAAESFINGDWLELYVYHAIQSSGRFASVACRLKATIPLVENEIDVVLTYNGRLGLLECKCGSLNNGKGQAYLNKLATLRNYLGGIFGQSFLVVTEVNPSDPLKQRARDYHIELVDFNHLENIEQIVFTIMSQRSR